MRKILISGLVAATAVLGAAGAALAEAGTTGTTGTASTAIGGAPLAGAAKAVIARMASSGSVAARADAARLERVLEQRPQASGSGSLYIGTGVSCASPTACLAIGMGGTANSGKLLAVAERLHAGKWKSVPVKTPKGAVMTLLDGVSCKAATYCLVVGDSLSDSAPLSSVGDSPLVMSWNGTALTRVAAPPVPKADELQGLSGVSCVAVKSCVVIGTGDVLTTGDTVQFVWTLSGTKWKVTAITEPGTGSGNVPPTGPGPSPTASPSTSTGTAPATSTQLSGLRCFSPTSCVAIGESDTITGTGNNEELTAAPLADYWNGKTFTSLKVPAPSGTANATLTGLACVSTHACAVVGVARDSSGIKGLGFAEVWNGKAWTVTKWGGPKGDTDAELLGVSCTSAVRCMAVGEHGTVTTVAPAALAWGGSKWKLLHVPGAGKGKAAVFGHVSCPVNGKCVATGEAGKLTSAKPSLVPLSGFWNGSAWKYGPMFAAA